MKRIILHSRTRALAMLTVAVCLAATAAKAECPTIDFENLAVNTAVTTQYRGVTFSVLPQTCDNKPTLYMRIRNPVGGTSSGTRCLMIDTGCPDFSDDYLRMVFARAQGEVTFTLGEYPGTYAIRYYSTTSGAGLIGSFNVVLPGPGIAGVYRFVRVASASSNIRRIEVEEAVGSAEAIDDLTFDMDTTAPEAEITSPTQLACVCNVSAVVGSAYDPDGELALWRLHRKALGATSWTLIRSSTTPVTNDTLATWTTTAGDGYYTLRLTAENECGLETVWTTDVYLDKAMNTLSLRSPAVGQVLGGTVCADGTAWDHCGGTIALAYRLASGGAWHPFDTVSTPWVITDSLGAWNTRTVSDGDYVVRLIGRDDCDNAATNEVTIVVDNKPPGVSLTAPTPCAAVNGLVPIRGTAIDAHLQNWALYYTGGAAHNWVLIAANNTPVNNGTLATWDTTALTPCAYALRLVVTDQSALDCNSALRNQSEYTVTVSVVDDPLAEDTDADGMPDAWETAHGLDPNSPADAAQDADADGGTNLAECLAGTDPRNAGSALRITAIRREADDIRVTWTTEGSHHYVLQSGLSLSAGVHSNVSPLISVPAGGSATTNFLHPGAANLLERYYRVRLGP